MMLKRIISLVIAILMCLLLVPLESNAAEKYLNPTNVVDSAPGSGIMVKNLSDGQDAEFDYNLEDGEVAIISFFNVGCYNCSQMFQSMINNGLNTKSKVKLVGIELSGVSREEIQAYVKPYISQFSKDCAEVYYNDTSNSIFAQYATNVFKRDGGFTLPVTFIVSGENGNKTIKYYYEGINTEGLKNSVLSLLDEQGSESSPEPTPEPTPTPIQGNIDKDATILGNTIDISVTKMYDFAKEVFKMVNDERAKEGLKPLTYDENLTEYAMKRAAELALYVDHERPNGSQYFTVIEDRNSSSGENIAAGQISPNEVMLSEYGWMNSPGHKANIMENMFSAIGVGCVFNNGIYYWVQIFSGEVKEEYSNKSDCNAIYTLETTEKHMNPSLSQNVIDIDMKSKGTINVFNSGSQKWIIAKTIPYNAGNVVNSKDYTDIIATAKINRNTGMIEITPVKTGSGIMEVIAFKGQTTPLYVTVNITGDDTGIEGASPFIDIQNHWAKNDIIKVVERGLFKGTSETMFSPDNKMTREQMWLVLSRYLGEGQSNFENAKNWAMTKGISDGSNPKGQLSREQFVTLLWRALGESSSSYDLSEYSDYNTISTYAREAFAWAVEMGLVNGTTPNTLSPQKSATRAQIATIFERLYK